MQRDLSPDLKRVVKNLTCQEHKYVYCPCCKQYDEVDYDPIENIDKFMKFIKTEQEKLFPKRKRKFNAKGKERDLPDDSVSDITDLDENDIL